MEMKVLKLKIKYQEIKLKKEYHQGVFSYGMREEKFVLVVIL